MTTARGWWRGGGEAADLGGSPRVEPVLDDGPQPDHKVGRVDDEAATHELRVVEVMLVGLACARRLAESAGGRG